MDAARALADLMEISSQIRAAVVLEADGSPAGSTSEDADRTGRLAEGVVRLLEQAAAVASAQDGSPPVQLQVATPEGSVFVVREGGRTIAATAAADPTVGLVFYDLKSTLRRLAEEEAEEEEAKPKPKPRAKRTPKGKAENGDADAAS